MTEIKKKNSWMCRGAVCGTCGSNVVVTQGIELDYRWYCANPECPNHTAMDDLGDMEEPEWIRNTI